MRRKKKLDNRIIKIIQFSQIKAADMNETPK